MVYEDGVLQGLGFAGLSPGGDGLDWTVPMFSVTFMIGVALDYDYFLFERVYEFREQGFGDREAIQLGLSPGDNDHVRRIDLELHVLLDDHRIRNASD